MQLHIERVYASERLGSSHGPDVFYELVYGKVSRGPGLPPSDAVLIRMVIGNDSGPAEIHVDDLKEVQQSVNDFMDRVRRKIDPSAMPYVPSMATPAPFAAPPPAEAPVGRYAPDAPRRRVGAGPGSTPTPFAVSMGPKKGNLEPGAITPRPILRPGQLEPEQPKERPLEETYRIISYNLSAPPSAEALVRQLDEVPELLVVVARFDLVQKVEDYLVKAAEAGGRAVPTSDFVTIVVNREHKRRNPSAIAKTKAGLAGGLQRMLGLPKAVLWIPPEA